ncbi:type i restriction-modification system specificity subunit [Levilactobacillus senmaizukei DSM 21775 = NBRC 103853]|uniref:Type i restriction-modification system specificity subunit n=2 Tax=Levilactobacillus senmaizukei TaxID=431273 RepID=A0A0R2DL56_9LACO|nr:type i restriction-modification system specificity subunit [Levilactobacillus senmaizukei DSM 21775 = NBRC 103853]
MTSQNRRLTMKDKQAKYPQLRFKGFTDAWVQRNLSELLQERNHQIEPNDEYELMSFVAGTGVTPKGERYDRSALVTNDSKKYKVTEFGDFIYSSNNLETGSIGFNKTGKAVISPVYSIFYSTENADSRFIGLLSSQKNFIHSMVRYRQGVVYGQWRIHESDFLKIAVFTPKLDEQNKIIEFFERFDKLIAANQRKLDLLKEQKKGYLQKMFPKNGAKVPELRFAGFADAWEQRKLGAITDSFSGGTPTAGKAEYYGGEIPFIRSGEISSDSTELFITDAGLNNSSAKMVGIGDILYALYGATSGETSISRINGAINQAILAIRPTKGDDPYMIVQWLKKQKETIISTYLQGGQGNLSGSIVKDLLITLPKNKDEQAKVGSFFKQLDQTITLHQRKLEKLQELKKGYLQKMFC